MSAAPTAAGHNQDLEVAIGRTLRWGAILAGVLLAGTLLLALLDGGWSHGATPSPGSLSFRSLDAFWRGLLSFEPNAVGTVALLVLLILPPARVALAAVIFAKERDLRYLVFSLVALAILVASNLIGIFVLRS